MMGVSHAITGAVAWAVVAHHSGFAFTPLTLGTAVIASLAPDIDHPDSWIGRRLFVIAYPLSFIIRHRGVTHSFLVMASLTALGSLYTAPTTMMPAPWASAFLVGYGAHLLGDAVTAGGIPLLWPWKRSFALSPGIKTGTLQEIALILAFLMGAAFVYAEPMQEMINSGITQLRCMIPAVNI